MLSPPRARFATAQALSADLTLCFAGVKAIVRVYLCSISRSDRGTDSGLRVSMCPRGSGSLSVARGATCARLLLINRAMVAPCPARPRAHRRASASAAS